MTTATLKFAESTHRYWLDGKPIPGVTTLIKNGLPKPALMYWSARTVAEYVADNPADIEQLRDMGREPMVAALKSIPWEKRDRKALRGTQIHALADRLIHGQEVEVPEDHAPLVTGYVDFLDAFSVEPLLTERAVASRTHWYAGTFDAIVRINGETLLLDWKTSSGVYGETALQTAAYANAEFYVDGDGQEQPLPHIDGLGVVHITEAGSSLYRFADPAAAWKDFRHVAWVANATDRIKAQLPTLAEVPQIRKASA